MVELIDAEAGYLTSALLWIAGVIAVIARKLRSG